MKRETFSDASIFRRGFYSCPEEHHDDVSEYAEMGRKTSLEKEVVFNKNVLRKRRIPKKVKLIRKYLRKAALLSRRRR